MSRIDPLFKILASLLDSYDVQLSLIDAIGPGYLRTMAIASLRRKISQDTKVLDILEDSMLDEIRKEADKSFDSVALVSEASRDEDKRTLTELRIRLALESVQKEMALESQFATAKKYFARCEELMAKL